MQATFDTDIVLQQLEHRLGWNSPTEAGYDIIDCDNEKTLTGRYYNDDSFHPATNIQYIKDCQPNPAITNDEFNKYLRQLVKSNIIDAVGQCMQSQSTVETGLLFETTEHFNFTGVVSNGQHVGIRFLLERDYVINITNVIFHFDADVEFTLYLHNQFVGKVASWKIKAKANAQYIFPLDKAIMHNSSVVKGGAWFLSYDQNELGNAKAIDYNPQRRCFSCMNAMSFASRKTGTGTFDMATYSTTWNMYGMNIEVSNYLDMTQNIVNNAHQFDQLLGMMMASKVLDIIINTSRKNEKERITKALQTHFYREQNNVTTSENPFDGGLRKRITKEISKVQKSFLPKRKAIVVDQ